MFMNDMKFRYVYLNNMKNVVWEQPAERPVVEGMEVNIHHELRDVLDRLMRERPTWRYKTTQDFFGAIPTVRHAYTFDIYDEDEALGRLWVENHWRDSTPRFYFDNFRLRGARHRSMANYTTKPTMAVKRIIKAFHLKTPSERAHDNASEVRKAVGSVVSSTSWPLRKARSAIESELLEYATRNWETFKHNLSDSVAKIDLVGLTHTYESAKTLSDRLEKHGGRVVHIGPNETYFVSRAESGGYSSETLSAATLPDELRRAVGLLKLVQDGDTIPNVGIRCNANLYFVIDPQGDA